jgi:hypothetical protein
VRYGGDLVELPRSPSLVSASARVEPSKPPPVNEASAVALSPRTTTFSTSIESGSSLVSGASARQALTAVWPLVKWICSMKRNVSSLRQSAGSELMIEVWIA